MGLWGMASPRMVPTAMGCTVAIAVDSRKGTNPLASMHNVGEIVVRAPGDLPL